MVPLCALGDWINWFTSRFPMRRPVSAFSRCLGPHGICLFVVDALSAPFSLALALVDGTTIACSCSIGEGINGNARKRGGKLGKKLPGGGGVATRECVCCNLYIFFDGSRP